MNSTLFFKFVHRIKNNERGKKNKDMKNILKIKFITPIMWYLGVMLLVEAIEYLIIAIYISDYNYNMVFNQINAHQEVTGLIAAMIMIAVLFGRRKQNGLKISKNINFLYINIPLLGIVACIAISSIISLVMQGQTEPVSSRYMPLTILATGICMPIAEEMIFRGLIYERMRSTLGASISAFISSILFAILHSGKEQAMYALAFGLIAVLVYEMYDRNILSSIILHISANVTAIIFNSIGFNQEKTKFVITTIIMLVLTVILLFIISIFSRGLINIRESDKGKEFKQWQNRRKKQTK